MKMEEKKTLHGIWIEECSMVRMQAMKNVKALFYSLFSLFILLLFLGDVDAVLGESIVKRCKQTI